METKFNFKSQICTTREQSERLIALGLKKETADMYKTPSWGGVKIVGYYAPNIVILDGHFDVFPNDLPAWSLHRLIELRYGDNWIAVAPKINIIKAYDNFIDAIEEAIKEGYFNKEYLENGDN